MNQTLERKKAARTVKDFERKFGSTVLDLASHAALPVAFNSELLHLIRINFFIDRSEPLPFTAETDIQLSSLCLEIDDDLYEIPRFIRDHLLQRLKHKRIKELAALIWQYTERFLPWRENVRLDRAQKLMALRFLNPEKANDWLNEAEMKNYSYDEVLIEREWFIAIRREIEKNLFLHSIDEIDANDLFQDGKGPFKPSPKIIEEYFARKMPDKSAEIVNNIGYKPATSEEKFLSGNPGLMTWNPFQACELLIQCGHITIMAVFKQWFEKPDEFQVECPPPAKLKPQILMSIWLTKPPFKKYMEKIAKIANMIAHPTMTEMFVMMLENWSPDTIVAFIEKAEAPTLVGGLEKGLPVGAAVPVFIQLKNKNPERFNALIGALPGEYKSGIMKEISARNGAAKEDRHEQPNSELGKMEYNFNVIRKLIDAAFSSDNFETFCFDHFNPVYQQFTAGQLKGHRILMLVDHARRYGLLSKLFEEIRKVNPHQYAQYERQLIKNETFVEEDDKNNDVVSTLNPFIIAMASRLVSEKDIHNLSRNYRDFEFIGYKEARTTIDFVSFVTADHLTEKKIVSLCDKYFQILLNLKVELGIKPRGRNPNGLIGFVFKEGCSNSLVTFIQKQSRISHGIPQGGIVYSWIFDLKTCNLHTHKNPISLLPPKIISPRLVYPGFDYYENFLKSWFDGKETGQPDIEKPDSTDNSVVESKARLKRTVGKDQFHMDNIHRTTHIPDEIVKKIVEKAEREYPEDYSKRKYVIETEVKAWRDAQNFQAPDVPGDVLEKIMEKAAREYPEDHSTRKYVIESEVKAWRDAQNFQAPDVPDEVLERIMEKAAREYPEDYSTKKYVIESEVKAWRDAQNFQAPDMPDDVLEIIMEKATREYPEDHSTRKYVIETEVKAWRDVQNYKTPEMLNDTVEKIATLHDINKNSPKFQNSIKKSAIQVDQTSMNSLRNALMDCDEFQNPGQLNALFNISELKPWQAGLPQANTLSQRVDLTIDYLLGKHRASGENGLVLLLNALGSRYDPADERYERLSDLAYQLKRKKSDKPKETTSIATNDLKNIFLRYAAKSDGFISTEKMLNETGTNTLSLILINQTFEVLKELGYIEVHRQRRSGSAPEYDTLKITGKGLNYVLQLENKLGSASPSVSQLGNDSRPFNETAFIMRMADALLACRTMSDSDSRKTAVGLLPDVIKQKINHKTAGHEDVVEIIRTCMAFDGGLQELMEILRHFEKGAICMKDVETAMREYRS